MALPGNKTTGKHAKVEQAYQRALCNQLWGLQRNGILCDVTLQVEGELIGVHAAVLSSSSTYLKDLCVQLRAMPNSNSRVIQIHHSTVLVCQKMIEYLYTGRSSQFTAEEQQDFSDLCLSWMVPNPTDYDNSILETQGTPTTAKKAKTTKNTQSPTKTWTDLAPLDELEDSIMKETDENNDHYAEANDTPEMDDSDNDANEGRRERRSELLVEEQQEKCDICHIIFYNRNLLVAHNVEFHYQDGMELPQEYVCTVPGCEYKTFYSKAMAAHEDYHYKTGVSFVAEPAVWKCTECGRRCSNEASLKAHQETHKRKEEQTDSMMCDLCSKVFNTNVQLKGHIKRVHYARDRMVCPQCGYQTLKSDIMKEHMFQKHDILPASGKLIQCEHCDHQSTSGRFAATHSLKHNCSSHISQFAIDETEEWIASILFDQSGPLMSCPMCPEFKFKPTRLSKVESHLQTTHDKLAVRLGAERVCQCEICGQGFKHKRYLANHMRNCHSAELTILQCLKCEYTTPQRHLLKLHNQSKHTRRERNFECKACTYKSYDRSNLRKHMRFIHGLQPDGTPTTKSTKRKPNKKRPKPVEVTAGCDVILTGEGMVMAMSGTEYEIPPSGNAPQT